MHESAVYYGQVLSQLPVETLWKLFPISIEPYRADYPAIYSDMEARLADVMRGIDVKTDHIGSTSVPSLAAKPIIDILMQTDGRNFPEVARRLSQEGWITMSSSERRISFNYGYTPCGYAQRVYHLHLRQYGDDDEIYFARYLRGNPSEADRYLALKRKALSLCGGNRDAYTEAKTDFVREITAKARKMYGV